MGRVRDLLIAALAFGAAGFIYVNGTTGGDPDWWNWNDLIGLHHESLFAVFIIIGVIAVYAAWRGI
jgi:hypothetical protein